MRQRRPVRGEGGTLRTSQRLAGQPGLQGSDGESSREGTLDLGRQTQRLSGGHGERRHRGGHTRQEVEREERRE
ncbi:hypothetical protein BV898_19705 [Hypsibius exemplaris]|uniref:Uncharacterized protein n=1 Tax=Hypsibius exemplaris TaxID=2072580 RepID=A0A9X6NK56_HYPEX|nr:hypothetical protein BV898_19705 [Hypsibius exemplaris]